VRRGDRRQPIDVYHRTGQYRTSLPGTLGREGRGIDRWAPASRTCGPATACLALVPGAYAEKAAVPADRLVRLPEGVSPRPAAAAMLQGMTAHYLASATYPLEPGEVALVHAAAGGVGLLLCQVGRIRGARMFGTVSTPQKAALAREAGAETTIDYTTQDFSEEAHRLTDGRGVEVVYDSVGRTTYEKSLSISAPRGMLVLFGQSSGAVSPIDPQVLSDRARSI
jgi:NADPH2:quinone reductase